MKDIEVIADGEIILSPLTGDFFQSDNDRECIGVIRQFSEYYRLVLPSHKKNFAVNTDFKRACVQYRQKIATLSPLRIVDTVVRKDSQTHKDSFDFLSPVAGLILLVDATKQPFLQSGDIPRHGSLIARLERMKCSFDLRFEAPDNASYVFSHYLVNDTDIIEKNTPVARFNKGSIS